jgi:CRP-like cAMP-binding protein
MRGQVSVTVDVPGGRVARLSTISPGMAFGELAVIDRSTRTADVRADAPAECRLLSAEVLDRLGDTDPEIKMRILENLLRSVHRMVSRLNHELWTLEGATEDFFGRERTRAWGVSGTRDRRAAAGKSQRGNPRHARQE